MGNKCVELNVIALRLSQLHRMFNMAHHSKEFSADLKKKVTLHKDGLGYKNIANTLKLSCSAVAKTIQFHSETNLAMVNQRS